MAYDYCKLIFFLLRVVLCSLSFLQLVLGIILPIIKQSFMVHQLIPPMQSRGIRAMVLQPINSYWVFRSTAGVL